MSSPAPVPTLAEYRRLYAEYGDVEAFRAVAQEHGHAVAEELDRRRYREILRADRGAR